jgi:hypothetical protein
MQQDQVNKFIILTVKIEYIGWRWLNIWKILVLFLYRDLNQLASYFFFQICHYQ